MGFLSDFCPCVDLLVVFGFSLAFFLVSDFDCVDVFLVVLSFLLSFLALFSCFGSVSFLVAVSFLVLVDFDWVDFFVLSLGDWAADLSVEWVAVLATAGVVFS